MKSNRIHSLIKTMIGISACVITWLNFLKRIQSPSSTNAQIESEDLESLELEPVIKWFKDNQQIINDNKDVIGVLLKPGEAEKITGKRFLKNQSYNLTFIQALFNKNQMSLEKYRQINCKSVSDDIRALLNEKDMLIFN